MIRTTVWMRTVMVGPPNPGHAVILWNYPFPPHSDTCFAAQVSLNPT